MRAIVETRASTQAPTSVWLFWGTLVAYWLVSLQFRALIHPDEGRYATLAMGMLQSGDWITPRLNGLLYFEKPIFQYWVSAVFFGLMGFSEFAARLWPGLSGLMTIAVVGFTARRLWSPTTGHHAALVCTGTLWMYANSHFLTLDMGVTFFLTLALCAFLLAHQSTTDHPSSRRWMLLAWAAMAGATLSKGLIGLLIPGGTLFLYCLTTREWRLLGRMHWLAGVVVFALITTPWFWLVSQRNPGFAHFFFIHEHIERFLTTEHHREGPPYYFIPIVLAGFLPWTSWLPRMLRSAWADHSHSIQVGRFLILWSSFVFVFFSLSGSKLPSYILPMFPAMALMLARTLDEAKSGSMRRHLVLPAAVWVVLLGIAPMAHRWASAESPAAVLNAFAVFIAVAALIGLLGVGLTWGFLRIQNTTAALQSLVLSTVLATGIVFLGHDQYATLKSSKEVVSWLQQYLEPDTEVFSVGMYEHTFPFYLRRPVTLVAYVDEFQFGETAEPQRWIPTLEAFKQRWLATPKAMAMTSPEVYKTLLALQVPMRVIYRDPRRLVVMKPE
ncbi:MAG TPA: glycosyltransferase family 39 protein [Limnobacter sp.]|uniref:glycosyltransferase family 39 protein n=1 Tax=Limnobacter sp. TaxID=2003368 RepID=UPI002EDB3149